MLTLFSDSGDTFPAGYDSSIFGSGHADCIISVSLFSLRKYGKWARAEGVDERVSPGRKILVEEIRLQAFQAEALHELLVRLRLPPVWARAPGTAIPPQD